MVADGEQIQIEPVENDEVSKILTENKIDFAKGPASSTNTIGNACDRSNLFKASKKVLKSLTSLTLEDFQDPVLEAQLRNDYKQSCKLYIRKGSIPDKRNS